MENMNCNIHGQYHENHGCGTAVNTGSAFAGHSQYCDGKPRSKYEPYEAPAGNCPACWHSKDGKSKTWADAADRLLEALARDNQYIIADILIMFIEASGNGLKDYTPLGGAFKRAAKKGIITKIERPSKKALWKSNIYEPALKGMEQNIRGVK